jgi:hypothetical protein
MAQSAEFSTFRFGKCRELRNLALYRREVAGQDSGVKWSKMDKEGPTWIHLARIVLLEAELKSS